MRGAYLPVPSTGPNSKSLVRHGENAVCTLPPPVCVSVRSVKCACAASTWMFGAEWGRPQPVCTSDEDASWRDFRDAGEEKRLLGGGACVVTRLVDGGVCRKVVRVLTQSHFAHTLRRHPHRR
jgi:hypothetical protein